VGAGRHIRDNAITSVAYYVIAGLPAIRIVTWMSRTGVGNR
jgi:hypothetical protein